MLTDNPPKSPQMLLGRILALLALLLALTGFGDSKHIKRKIVLNLEDASKLWGPWSKSAVPDVCGQLTKELDKRNETVTALTSEIFQLKTSIEESVIRHKQELERIKAESVQTFENLRLEHELSIPATLAQCPSSTIPHDYQKLQVDYTERGVKVAELDAEIHILKSQLHDGTRKSDILALSLVFVSCMLAFVIYKGRAHKDVVPVYATPVDERPPGNEIGSQVLTLTQEKVGLEASRRLIKDQLTAALAAKQEAELKLHELESKHISLGQSMEVDTMVSTAAVVGGGKKVGSSKWDKVVASSIAEDKGKKQFVYCPITALSLRTSRSSTEQSHTDDVPQVLRRIAVVRGGRVHCDNSDSSARTEAGSELALLAAPSRGNKTVGDDLCFGVSLDIQLAQAKETMSRLLETKCSLETFIDGLKAQLEEAVADARDMRLENDGLKSLQHELQATVSAKDAEITNLKAVQKVGENKYRILILLVSKKSSPSIADSTHILTNLT